MNNRLWLSFIGFLVLLPLRITNANPISPCDQEFNPISEIQIIDSTHWSIEINGDYLINKTVPWDSLFIGVYKTSSSTMPDTYLTPVNKILFDSTSDVGRQHYIAVLTKTNFPGLKLFNNSKLSIRTVQLATSETINFACSWGITIDSTLLSNQSLVRIPLICWHYVDDGTPGPSDYSSYTQFIYVKCNLPSIGKINNYNGITNRVTGRIKDANNNILHGITINNPILNLSSCSPSLPNSSFLTDSNGKFNIVQIALYPSTFSFSDSKDQNTISKRVMGPFYGNPDTTIDVGDIVLDDYPPTGIINRNVKEAKAISSSSLNVLGVFSAINQKGVKIVIANNSNAPSPVILSILTVKGQKIRDISSIISSAGTNTISWDGKNASGKKVPAGMYVVNLYSNNSLLQKSYGVIQ